MKRLLAVLIAFAAIARAMKKAVDALLNLPQPPNELKLHILKKPGSSSSQLEMQLQAYIDAPPINGRVSLKIDEFEIAP